MKYRIIFFLGIFITFALNSHAQIKDRTPFTPPTVTPQYAPNVQRIELSIDSTARNGDTYFTATITSNGRGTIQYQWILTAQQTTPNAPLPVTKKDSIVLNGSGTDKVYLKQRKINNSTSVVMEMLTPNVVFSNVAHY